jgi:hypothetical protein
MRIAFAAAAALGRDSQRPLSCLLLFPLKATGVSLQLSLVMLVIIGYGHPAMSLASPESVDEFNQHLLKSKSLDSSFN